jgi:uncharacterized membrane protein
MKKIIFSFIALIFLISFVSAHTGDDDFGHHMMGGVVGTGMWGMGIFGWIFMILIIVALILLIIWLIKQIQKK